MTAVCVEIMEYFDVLVITVSGDNWNQRFQRIIALPESSTLERYLKYSELYALNKDFVNTATSYAQTIISEYFLHVKDKSIVAKSMGGVAGGQVEPPIYITHTHTWQLL
jgi:hypothetical protein